MTKTDNRLNLVKQILFEEHRTESQAPNLACLPNEGRADSGKQKHEHVFLHKSKACELSYIIYLAISP